MWAGVSRGTLRAGVEAGRGGHACDTQDGSHMGGQALRSEDRAVKIDASRQPNFFSCTWDIMNTLWLVMGSWVLVTCVFEQSKQM